MLTSKKRLLVLAAIFTLAAPASSFAQEEGGDEEAQPGEEEEAQPGEDDLAKAKEHFATGKQLFDEGKFEEAVAAFKESYRLSKNPLLLYNIGFTLDQAGDAQFAVFYYKKFLNDSAADAANRDAAEARIQELEGGGATDASGEDGGDSAATSFEHTVVDAAPPGAPIDVTAVVPEGVSWTVTVFYRTQGATTFSKVIMSRRYNELVGRIPAAALKGSSVQYYIEVQDASGSVIDRSGESTSPHLVILDPDAKPRFYADFSGEGTASFSGGFGGGEEPGTGPTGGWTDARSSRFQYIKWGATAGTGLMVLLAGGFYVLSSDAANELESDAIASRDEDCASGPPCRIYAGKQKDLQSKGERYELLANVSLGVGAAAAVTAGVFWFLEMRGGGGSADARAQKSQKKDRLVTAPVVSQDFVGGAATLRF